MKRTLPTVKFPGMHFSKKGIFVSYCKDEQPGTWNGQDRTVISAQVAQLGNTLFGSFAIINIKRRVSCFEIKQLTDKSFLLSDKYPHKCKLPMKQFLNI